MVINYSFPILWMCLVQGEVWMAIKKYSVFWLNVYGPCGWAMFASQQIPPNEPTYPESNRKISRKIEGNGLLGQCFDTYTQPHTSPLERRVHFIYIHGLWRIMFRWMWACVLPACIVETLNVYLCECCWASFKCVTRWYAMSKVSTVCVLLCLLFTCISNMCDVGFTGK